jgi:hypothetical protein
MLQLNRSNVLATPTSMPHVYNLQVIVVDVYPIVSIEKVPGFFIVQHLP